MLSEEAAVMAEYHSHPGIFLRHHYHPSSLPPSHFPFATTTVTTVYSGLKSLDDAHRTGRFFVSRGEGDEVAIISPFHTPLPFSICIAPPCCLFIFSSTFGF
jgi:hypothetical protein